MANFILRNISGSNLSLNIFADTPAAILEDNQTINLLEYASTADALNSLHNGELRRSLVKKEISIVKNSIGFIKKNDCVLSSTLIGTTVTLNVDPVDTNFAFNQQITDGNGKLVIATYIKSAQDSINITVVLAQSAFYLVYYNGSTLSYKNVNTIESTTFSDTNQTEVCYLWYEATLGTVLIFDQRQDAHTNWVENALNDETKQIKYKSGLQLTTNDPIIVDGQVSISSGHLIQNTSDINVVKTGTGALSFEQTLNPLTALVLFRNDDLVNVGGVNWNTYTNPSAFVMYKFGTAETGYNKLTGTAWTIEKADVGKYVPYWIVGTSCITNPIMVIAGQDQYSTLEEAFYQSRFDKLVLDNLVFRTFKPLYRVMVKTDLAATIVNITDLRSKTFVGDHISAAKGGGSGGTVTFGQDLAAIDTVTQKVVGLNAIPLPTTAPVEGDALKAARTILLSECPMGITSDATGIWVADKSHPNGSQGTYGDYGGLVNVLYGDDFISTRYDFISPMANMDSFAPESVVYYNGFLYATGICSMFSEVLAPYIFKINPATGSIDGYSLLQDMGKIYVANDMLWLTVTTPAIPESAILYQIDPAILSSQTAVDLSSHYGDFVPYSASGAKSLAYDTVQNKIWLSLAGDNAILKLDATTLNLDIEKSITAPGEICFGVYNGVRKVYALYYGVIEPA